jgi:hypothetical protein
MALWITKQRALPGPVFGSVDKFEGLGVFFDTYKNSRHGAVFPYVTAMLGMGPRLKSTCNRFSDRRQATEIPRTTQNTIIRTPRSRVPDALYVHYIYEPQHRNQLTFKG